jgi:hypothetical protein
MGGSKVIACEFCGISHGRFVCPAVPGTLERAEWELGKKDGIGDGYYSLPPQEEYARARRSPYYFVGYKKGVDIGRLQEEADSHSRYDREELDQW